MAALYRFASVQQTLDPKHAKLLSAPEAEAAFRPSLRCCPPSPCLSSPISWKVSARKSMVKSCPAAGITTAASVEDPGLDSEAGISYIKLRDLLAAGEWELADEETRRLIIVLAGENAVKRKYVFFSEVQFIPVTDLRTIDRLWREHSNGKFGYSVQRKIMKIADGDCTVFFKKVGWMRPLGSETLQYTYRSFPTEFTWELSSSVPEGHLPLTNALRGTQLLKGLLAHPAFAFVDEIIQVPASSCELLMGDSSRQQTQSQSQKKPLSINYSF